LVKYEYNEARAGFLIFGDGLSGEILKRFGEKDEIFWIKPTPELMIKNNMKTEDLINGVFLEYKCPNPDDNLMPMNKDSAFGRTLCLLDVDYKETNVCRRLIDNAMRERLKSQDRTIESLQVQLRQRDNEMDMMSNRLPEWIKKRSEISELHQFNKESYEGGSNE